MRTYHRLYALASYVILAGATTMALQLIAPPATAQEQPGVATMLKKFEPINSKGPYQTTWESLHEHKDPEWFRDAKFGIYTHWGPVTVGSDPAPCDAEWYGKQLYEPSGPDFEYHKKRFGDQHTFGYKDVIPHFTAEKFDAEAWAELFSSAGAKFAGPVAVHHDNFAMWASDVTRWNSQNMGPHRDIIGELEKAYRKRGLKFITTFHHGFAWRYFEPSFAFDGADGKNADLYSEPHGPKDPPSQRFQDAWLAKVDEVLLKYQPDLIWFDFELAAVITPEYQRKMFASTYNWAAANHREIGVTHKFRDIHEHTGILDFERGREDRLVPYPWLTDTSIGPWFHHERMGYRPTAELIHVFVDIVSKNGCLLLNVGPRADGTIPEKAQTMLRQMGAWLKINGEAIYGTCPWLVYGEGPSRMKKRGGFSEGSDRFTAQDIRFTTKGEKLYAIALGWPEGGKLVIRSLAKAAGPVSSVSLLGHDGSLEATQTEEGMHITLPKNKPCEFAYAFAISGEHLKPVELKNETAVRPAQDGSVRLDPESADLHGDQIRVEEQRGQTYIAAWDRPSEWASWSIQLPAKAAFDAVLDYSAAYADTEFDVTFAGHTVTRKATKTPTWFDFATQDVGRFDVPAAGKYEFSIRPHDPAKWKAINVRAIVLRPARP